MGFYLEGLLNPINDEQEVFAGFRIGLLARYMISQSIGVQFEPGYHQLQGLNMYSKLRQDAIYDFGLNTQVYAMKANTAHFVSFPVSLTYQTEKHGFELGYDINYLLGVQGDVQEVTLQNMVNEPSGVRSAKVDQVVENVSNGWLDMSPFGSTSNRLFAGYNYKVSNGFMLGARAYYQPKSILETPPSELTEQQFTKLLIGVQAKFVIE